MLNEEITKALETFDHVKIINLEEPENYNIGDSEINLPEGAASRSAAGTILYDVRNIKELSHTYGSDYLNVSGAPDIVIGLSDSRTKAYSITFGATYGCQSGVIANATWGTTSSRTLTYSGTWTVPKTHNGKKVLRGSLHMRPEYRNKQYDIYSKVNGYTNWSKKGTSQTQRAIKKNYFNNIYYIGIFYLLLYIEVNLPI